MFTACLKSLVYKDDSYHRLQSVPPVSLQFPLANQAQTSTLAQRADQCAVNGLRPQTTGIG